MYIFYHLQPLYQLHRQEDSGVNNIFCGEDARHDRPMFALLRAPRILIVQEHRSTGVQEEYRTGIHRANVPLSISNGKEVKGL